MTCYLNIKIAEAEVENPVEQYLFKCGQNQEKRNKQRLNYGYLNTNASILTKHIYIVIE